MVHPLGFELRVETNDARVLDAACASWPEADRQRGFAPLSLRVFVGRGPLCPSPPTHRADGGRLALFADPNHGATADLEAGGITVWVTDETVLASQRLRRWFLDGPVLEALSFQAVTPIHAAAIVCDGRATLLCGAAGAGKSTLAAACIRAGWSLLGDDAAYLLRGTDRLLGRGGPLRLDGSSVRLLGGDDSAVRGDAFGEEIAEMVPFRETGEAALGSVAFLERPSEGPGAKWEAIAPGAALERLVAELPLGTPAVTRLQVDSLQEAAGLARRLIYRDLAAAEALLRAASGSRP